MSGESSVSLHVWKHPQQKKVLKTLKSSTAQVLYLKTFYITLWT